MSTYPETLQSGQSRYGSGRFSSSKGNDAYSSSALQDGRPLSSSRSMPFTVPVSSHRSVSRPSTSSENTFAARSRPSVELFVEYDVWANQMADHYIRQHPVVQLVGRAWTFIVTSVKRLGYAYLDAHTATVHIVAFFCFLSSLTALFIAYTIDCNISAFAIPAVHHKWDLREKAEGCRNASFYYLLIGVGTVGISWARRRLPLLSGGAGLRGLVSVPTPQQQRLRRRRQGGRTAQRGTAGTLVRNDASEASEVSDDELQPIVQTHLTAGSAHTLHSRSGYTSSNGGYSTSGGAVSNSGYSSPHTEVALGVSGRIPPNRMKLVGLGDSDSGF